MDSNEPPHKCTCRTTKNGNIIHQCSKAMPIDTSECDVYYDVPNFQNDSALLPKTPSNRAAAAQNDSYRDNRYIKQKPIYTDGHPQTDQANENVHTEDLGFLDNIPPCDDSCECDMVLTSESKVRIVKLSFPPNQPANLQGSYECISEGNKFWCERREHLEEDKKNLAESTTILENEEIEIREDNKTSSDSMATNPAVELFYSGEKMMPAELSASAHSKVNPIDSEHKKSERDFEYVSSHLTQSIMSSSDVAESREENAINKISGTNLSVKSKHKDDYISVGTSTSPRETMDDKVVPLLQGIYDVLNAMKEEKQNQGVSKSKSAQLGESLDQIILEPKPVPVPPTSPQIEQAKLNSRSYENMEGAFDKVFINSEDNLSFEPPERDVESFPETAAKSQRLIPVDMDLLRADEQAIWEPLNAKSIVSMDKSQKSVEYVEQLESQRTLQPELSVAKETLDKSVFPVSSKVDVATDCPEFDTDLRSVKSRKFSDKEIQASFNVIYSSEKYLGSHQFESKETFLKKTELSPPIMVDVGTDNPVFDFGASPVKDSFKKLPGTDSPVLDVNVSKVKDSFKKLSGTDGPVSEVEASPVKDSFKKLPGTDSPVLDVNVSKVEDSFKKLSGTDGPVFEVEASPVKDSFKKLPGIDSPVLDVNVSKVKDSFKKLSGPDQVFDVDFIIAKDSFKKLSGTDGPVFDIAASPIKNSFKNLSGPDGQVFDVDVRIAKDSFKKLSVTDGQVFDVDVRIAKDSFKKLPGIDSPLLNVNVSKDKDSFKKLPATDGPVQDVDLSPVRESFQKLSGTDVPVHDVDVTPIRDSFKNLSGTGAPVHDVDVILAKDSIRKLSGTDGPVHDVDISPAKDSFKKISDIPQLQLGHYENQKTSEKLLAVDQLNGVPAYKESDKKLPTVLESERFLTVQNNQNTQEIPPGGANNLDHSAEKFKQNKSDEQFIKKTDFTVRKFVDAGTDCAVFDDDPDKKQIQCNCSKEPARTAHDQEMSQFIESIMLDIKAINNSRKNSLLCKPLNPPSSTTCTSIVGWQQPPSDLSYPVVIESVQELGSSSLFVKWRVLNFSNIAGYEIYLDGRLTNRYFNCIHKAAVICHVNLNCPHRITLCALPLIPLSSCKESNELCSLPGKLFSPNSSAHPCFSQSKGSVWYPSVYQFQPSSLSATTHEILY